MANAILDCTVTVLKIVSYDTELFFKKLYDALQSLLPYEAEELMVWVSSYINTRPQLKAHMIMLEVRNNI